MAKTTSINVKYQNKKNNTKQRGIDFDLTLEQFKLYWSLPNGVCDYTGEPFKGSGTDPNAPSLERIDKHKGYSIDNCCMVTCRANQLKDIIVDENGTTKLSLKDLEVLKSIADKIKHPETLTNPYLKLMGDKTNMANNVPTVTPSATTTHSDVALIKDYTSFANGKNVSFSKFKSLLSRKTCEVTKTTLTETGFKGRTFITKDNTDNFTDDNIMVVAKFVAGVVHFGLTNTELTRMINFIK